MAGRFVRVSAFRHVFGKPDKDDYQIPPTNNKGDSNYICGNGKFFACAKSGGGGPVMIRKLTDKVRKGLDDSVVNVHKAAVVEFAWNPFVDTILATGSEDARIQIVQIPEDGMKVAIKTPLSTCSGHQKKVAFLKFHPTASNVLASASNDQTVKLWDISNGAELASYDIGDAPYCVEWNSTGSLLASTSRDKMLRIVDPRDQKTAQSVKVIDGIKKTTMMFMEKLGYYGIVGATRSSRRVIKLYDPKKLDKEIATVPIDQSAGVLIPHFDDDTGVLFVGGKGDSSIKYFEIVNSAPYVHLLSYWSSPEPQKGFCFLPKTACDSTKCEIARALVLRNRSVVNVGFCVPRKSDLFQSDLFPDAYAGVPSINADEYMAGKNGEVVKCSMAPGEAVVKKTEFKAKKSYAQLESELEAAKKKIAELEAKLAEK